MTSVLSSRTGRGVEDGVGTGLTGAGGVVVRVSLVDTGGIGSTGAGTVSET